MSHAPAPRNPASLEVQTVVPGKGGVPKIPETDRASIIPDKDFWDGGVADGLNVGPRGDSTEQGLFCRRKAATLVKVKGIESRP